MRSIGIGAALSAATVVLSVATGAFAQPAPSDPGPAGATGPAPATSSGGATLSFGGATTTTPGADEGAKEEEAKAEEKSEKLAWRGTQLVFDQSASTHTVGLGKDYISDNPVYELNFSFRPRYYVYDGDEHSVNVNAQLELTQEVTNSDYTTQKNEVQFGNMTFNAVYGWTAYQNDDGVMTRLSIGPRFVIPTAKTSWRSGQRFQLGGGLAAMQAFPMAGVTSEWFPSAAVQGSAYYMKPIQNSTTGVNEDFERDRQDVNANNIKSNQISAGAKVAHQVTAMASASFDITQKLHLSGSYVWIMQWAYTFDQTEISPAGTGGLVIQPEEYKDATNFRVMPWFLVSVDYDLLPEVGLGAGYYNVTNQLGEDGQRRSPLWSPEARVFFDITANLDQIYTTIAGKRDKSAAEANARARQNARRTAVEAASSL